MSESSERGRQRLGQLVLARRKELGLSVREAARRAGVMRPTWTGLEQGNRRTADYNFAAMERTLDWRPGSFESVLGGGDPAPAEHVIPAPPPGEPTTEPTKTGPDAFGSTATRSSTIGPSAHSSGPNRPEAAGPGPAAEPTVHSAVPWSDIVDVLDAHLGGIGQATSVGGTQRLWGAEQITWLARRLRPQQVSRGGIIVVGWADVVASLEATIAAIRQDTTMSSEARLWGVEMVVDVATGMRAAQRDFTDDD